VRFTRGDLPVLCEVLGFHRAGLFPYLDAYHSLVIDDGVEGVRTRVGRQGGVSRQQVDNDLPGVDRIAYGQRIPSVNSLDTERARHEGRHPHGGEPAGLRDAGSHGGRDGLR
jgi:hypothetical protein